MTIKDIKDYLKLDRGSSKVNIVVYEKGSKLNKKLDIVKYDKYRIFKDNRFDKYNVCSYEIGIQNNDFCLQYGIEVEEKNYFNGII